MNMWTPYVDTPINSMKTGKQALGTNYLVFYDMQQQYYQLELPPLSLLNLLCQPGPQVRRCPHPDMSTSPTIISTYLKVGILLYQSEQTVPFYGWKAKHYYRKCRNCHMVLEISAVSYFLVYFVFGIRRSLHVLAPQEARLRKRSRWDFSLHKFAGYRHVRANLHTKGCVCVWQRGISMREATRTRTLCSRGSRRAIATVVSLNLIIRP